MLQRVMHETKRKCFIFVEFMHVSVATECIENSEPERL